MELGVGDEVEVGQVARVDWVLVLQLLSLGAKRWLLRGVPVLVDENMKHENSTHFLRIQDTEYIHLHQEKELGILYRCR